MDKFTVDLEKVLDEFEYNEGREDAVLPSVIRNRYSYTSSRAVKSPAASYRRPSFEPINLSDADFAAAPSSVCEQFISVSKQKSFKDSKFNCINEESYSVAPATFGYSDDLNVQNKPIEEPSAVIEVCDNNISQLTNINDDTPDLLDSNSLKPCQNGVHQETNTETISQLPDITSVRSCNPEPEQIQVEQVFDLIKPHSLAHVADSDDINNLPPIIDVGTVIKEDLPVLQITPLTFESVNISESELYSYLDNLDVVGVNSNDNESDQVKSSLCGFCEIEKDLEECLQATINNNDNGNIEPIKVEISLTFEGSSSESDSCLTSPTIDLDYNPTNTGSLENVECEEQKDFYGEKTNCGENEVTNVNNENRLNEECFESSVELSENLENLETEREAIENRDNEKADESGPKSNSASPEDSPDMKPSRPNSLMLPHSHMLTDSEESPTPSNSSSTSVCGVTSPEERSLGKVAPYWVPDTEADSCMLCNLRFTVIKRRHHCRACGLVLCSKCCNLKAPLEYMEYAEARVCQPCFNIIYRGVDEGRYNRGRQPNPNNPMEYCSTVPPLQQASAHQPPPAVFVPTSVLKREGSRSKSEAPKQVMFSDGIRPGGDLTELDGSHETPRLLPRRCLTRKLASAYRNSGEAASKRALNPGTESFIPSGGKLPPTVEVHRGKVSFLPEEITCVTTEPVKFAINHNLFVNVKRTRLDCCVNRDVWSVASEGLSLVGQDEVALVIECLPGETLPHIDIFHLINFLWKQGALGSTTNEMCFTAWMKSTLFGSTEHSGFLYIRPTLQCVTSLLLPYQPYLVAILVHRWETAWARLFPLRLVLRLGAEYRYYPCPLVSVRNRQPLYTDVGHTIMKILVDFRKFSYSLATVRGLLIHVEDRQTTILFPRNRYDQVSRALNNSNESVLAFGANLSLTADSHLVCIQSTNDDNSYHTEAINIHNKPRKVTGASFVVFNGALKGSSGKSSIVEDGLMVHLPSERMAALRNALRSMSDFSISCGPNDEETVLLHWTHDDTNFNIGVRSCIDGQPLDGVPSIRVHNGTDYPMDSRIIRWTEVFIIQCEDGGKGGSEPLDISRVSESLSRATCTALLPLLESLATAGLTTIALRATIHHDNVGYDAGSCEAKLPPVYMNRLDDELVPVLHQAAITAADCPAVLELVFRIMNTA